MGFQKQLQRLGGHRVGQYPSAVVVLSLNNTPGPDEEPEVTLVFLLYFNQSRGPDGHLLAARPTGGIL